MGVWLAAINGLGAEWWLAGLRSRWQPRALALAVLLVVPLGYSLLRWSTLETRPAARVLSHSWPDRGRRKPGAFGRGP